MLSAKAGDAVNHGFVKRAIRPRPVLNLWVLLVAFLLLATCFVAAIFFHWFTQLGSKFDALANFECEAAASAYESGGPQTLESVMHRHEVQSGVRAYLFDSTGRNLGGGPDRAGLLSVKPLYLRALSRLRGQRIGDVDVRVVPQTSKYRCIVTSDLERRAFYGNRAVRLLAFLAILCYGIAGYVTLRLRRLEAAIRSFGAGKLEIRLPSNSRDPIRRLSQAFNQMASQIETLVDAHKRLCVDVSHELRSPLTRLRLAIGLARSGTHGALEQIELESVRLNELVDQLLDVARAEVDPTALRREMIDLESLVTEVVDDCTIEAIERGCELELRLDQPGSVLGDPELLRRAIENPLRNAIRHSPAGSSVEIACNGNADFAVISIRDSGPGVPDSDLDEIFKPFYRVEADRDRDTGGSGLGLAIVERAVALHRGSVKAENSAPGLKVEIRLPRR
jgi:two-component system sensor histidine kinase CpxA